MKGKKGVKCESVGRSFECRERERERERECAGGGKKKGEKVLDLVFREEGQNWVCRKKKCTVILFLKKK